jgi:hypothetical protein
VNFPVVRRFLLPHGVTLPRSAPLSIRKTAPLGSPTEEGDAVWISPPSTGPIDPVSISLTLPEPASMGAGLVMIGDLAGEAGLFSRLLGREVRVPRAVRGSALLLAGYRNVCGALDPASGLDLCWAEV